MPDTAPADPIADALRQLPLSNAQRADAWDAFHASPDVATLTTKLQALDIPKEAKAQLWDLKQADASTPATFHQENAVDEQGHSVVARLATAARDAIDNTAVGVVKGGLSTATNLGRLALHAPIVGRFLQAANQHLFGLSPEQQEAAFDDAAKVLEAHGVAESIGKGGEQLSELIVPSSEAAGLGEKASSIVAPYLERIVGRAGARLLPKMAIEGAATAGMAKAQGGSPVVGAALGAAGPLVGAGLSAAVGAVRPVARLTPEEIASNAFAEANGVPLDAATATGSRTLRAAEKRVANSMGGEGTAERLIADQQAGLARSGRAIADVVHPETVTPEQAGSATKGAIASLVDNLHEQANGAYDRLRAIESAPASAADVAKPLEISKPMTIRMQASLGGKVASEEELREMQRISEELKAVPYSPGKLVADAPGVASDTHYVPRSANAPVYHDILQAAPGTSKISGAQMVKAIDTAVETGYFTNPAKGALNVAQKRLAGSLRVSSPLLTPGAGSQLESMQAPVDLTEVKKYVQPLYAQMTRQMPIAQQQASPGLKALENIVTGPNFAPLSQADRDLSAVKAIARKEGGLAKFAVKPFDDAVQKAAAQLGPEATSALQEGRGATVAKYAAQDVLDTLREEPVQAFRQLTPAKDSNIALLRQAAELAPAEMPKIGRAWLEDALDQATERGRFDHADRLYANWQKLGPETKKVLFGDDTAGQLDQFFLLAKRLAENPNPSGTATTNNVFNWVSTVGSWPLAKLLYTPRGVSTMTKALASGPSSAAASQLRSMFSEMTAVETSKLAGAER